jgi:hypothetical protein
MIESVTVFLESDDEGRARPYLQIRCDRNEILRFNLEGDFAVLNFKIDREILESLQRDLLDVL